MKKLSVLLVSIFAVFLLVNTTSVFAYIQLNVACSVAAQNGNDASKRCDTNLFCKVTDQSTPDAGKCLTSNIQVTKPTQGFATLGNAISNILTLAFAVAVLLVLVMLILGAYEWMVSGGDKEAVGKARNRIINALIGLAVLALAYALVNVFGQFVGLDLRNIQIPAPDPNASGL